MATDGEPGRRRRCCAQDTPAAPAGAAKVADPRGDSDGPRRGSLCERHCAAINNAQADLGELGCHLHRPRGTPATSTPSCCQQHSEEVCESCVVKTTLTAENAVEANKLSNNYKFGFKKWKSHVTARPWEDRSEIVKELYSDLNIIRASGGSSLTCGNVLYLLLFGWWLSLLYVLVAAVMFITVMGAPYGRLCWDLAGYFLWPFGKVIQKVEVPKSPQASEASVGESSALLGGPTALRWRPRCWVGTGYWHHASTAVWLCLGYPLLALAHGLVCVAAWLLIVLIPVAKLSARAASRVLLLPPRRLLVRRLRMVRASGRAGSHALLRGGFWAGGDAPVPLQTEVPLEGEVILCCYRAANPYYYKYAVDGINVFAVNLLPLVLVTLVLGYVDSPNRLTGSAVKFTLALLSIMPLSYYIGMAIASISAQSNFAVGAVVNATFGSITELTFYITALIKGSREGNRCYAEVVKSALTGTLVGCVLFVPGLCMVIGGIRHQEQRFNSRSAGVSSALLFLSVGGVFAPTLFSKVYGKLVCGECHNVTQNPLGHYLCHNCHFDLMDNNGTLYYSHVQPLVYTVSILLPAAYLIGLFFTLKTHTHIYDIHISDCHSECPQRSRLQGWLLSLLWGVPHVSALSPVPGHHHSAVVHWSRWRALVILLLSTLCMSACADLATEHISPILTNSTISQYFIGVTVLAMVPELPEIVNGIQFALQNNLSLSIEIGNCIAVQVCMLQIPILVLFTIFYPTNFTLIFSDLHVYASMFSVVLMNYIFMDGKCDYFQGDRLPQGCCGTWGIPVFPGMWDGGSWLQLWDLLGLLAIPGSWLTILELSPYSSSKGDHSHFPL
ncbi:low affinity vacuolar monovalent cation/H(+) antiporter-like isoform X3 [Passer montanus]|uniref:low affinity vacuolar monovalent cation/H(+) antiporter-like isoform X3 n=1 Tax=Passer montanus TaxID=9160 RepID=UPI0019605058|nr:low affinity vacuolar monovalent cation/H(+) antiporter-like isoform X3 [Passer montanus]